MSTFSFGQSLDTIQQNRANLLTEIGEKIKDNYIFADIALKTDSLLNLEIKTANFKNLTNEEFAKKITTYLRTVTKDKHFFVKYFSDNQTKPNIVNEKEQQKSDNFSNSLENFGFENIKRLDGNIGYINFKGFAEPKASETALASAMNFIANTNSSIIDLRENRGGDGGMLLQFCSYFFNNKIKLYDAYYRNKGKNIENWTRNKVKGTKYLNKQVYILTSKNTFSAAEGLSYFLQSYGIAKVIGEQTGGAANPVDHFIIDNKYLLLVPNGKITAMLTKNNWEQIGVIPNEIVKKESALTKAHIIALNELLKIRNKTELSETEIRELIHKLEKEL
nr:S41 family peptidase [Flavobacterium urumqiense]